MFAPDINLIRSLEIKFFWCSLVDYSGRSPSPLNHTVRPGYDYYLGQTLSRFEVGREGRELFVIQNPPIETLASGSSFPSSNLYIKERNFVTICLMFLRFC